MLTVPNRVVKFTAIMGWLHSVGSVNPKWQNMSLIIQDAIVMMTQTFDLIVGNVVRKITIASNIEPLTKPHDQFSNDADDDDYIIIDSWSVGERFVPGEMTIHVPDGVMETYARLARNIENAALALSQGLEIDPLLINLERGRNDMENDYDYGTEMLR